MRAPHFKRWFAKLPALNVPQRLQTLAALRAGIRVRRGGAGAIHLQNVNACHQGSRQCWSRFRGVASRYLPNYPGWRWALDGGRITSAAQLLRIAIKLINNQR